MTEYLLPAKIIEESGVSNAKSLFQKKGLYGVHNMVEAEWNQNAKLEGKGSYIVLDFGKEMHGGVRVLTGWIYEGVCKVRIRFGESLGEVNASIGEKNATNRHSPRDFETLIPASGDVTIGETGFRFVRIDVLEEKYLYLRNVYCVNRMLSKKPIYTYQGCDERIADIFWTAKRTVDLCASEGYVWDGIKRDRLVWAGDLSPEIMALSAIYGRLPEIERSLDLAKKLAPLPKFMNGIYTYSAWWLITLADYYEEFACERYVKKHLPYIVGVVDRLGEMVGKNGELNREIRYLVDWPTKDSVDELTGVRIIMIMAMNKAVVLLKAFGLSEENALEIKRRLLLQPIDVYEKKQVIALKYFAVGEMSDEEYAKLIEGGAKGFSTFMSYYILTAIASRNKELAIRLMKDYYGGMLDRGATTFWEEFDIDWLDGSGRIDELDKTKKELHGDYGAHCYVGYRHSLCHGWAAGVARFIKEHC